MELEVLTERIEVDGHPARTALLLLRLSAPTAVTATRRPVNLSLLIDRSSSMRGPRLKQAIFAARELVRRLGPKDRLSIVAFDAAPTVLCEPGPVTESRRQEMEETLESMVSGVGTNIAAALRKGAEMIRSSYVRNSIARVLLLTDGQASIGVTNSNSLCDIGQAIFESGVAITTMGLGQGFDDDLLIELASRGHGGYYFLATPSDIPAAFGRELEGVFAISAQNTEIKLLLHEDIESVALLHKLPSHPIEDGLRVQVGDLSSGDPRQVLFRMQLSDACDLTASEVNLGRITVSYDNANGVSETHMQGIPLPKTPILANVQAIVAEDLTLRVASAVDRAWARRASGSSGQALLLLREMKQEVQGASDRDRCPKSIVIDLLCDIDAAETAIEQSDVEMEDARRQWREKSQHTQLGHSVIKRLTRED